MSIHRSMSASGMKCSPSQLPRVSHDMQSEGYLISSSLWEKVTGEKVSPSNMTAVLFSNSGAILSTKTLEIIKMTQDRAGSIEVQRILDESDAKERAFIIDSLIPKAAELSVHPCANFVIQKLCEKANQEQMNQLGEILYSNLNSILPAQSGSRVVQKFLEASPPQLVAPIYNLIKPSLINLSLSQNGNHIIHRVIEALPERAREIVQIATPNLNKLISNNFGCRIVQSMFKEYNKDALRPLINEVIRQANELSTSQYGNYIVQTVLDIGDKEDITKIVEVILDKFYEFSMHKLASNVTEKCIKTACQEERRKIFDVVIGKEGNFDYDRIFHLSTDQYGNYVIQRIIDFGTKEQHDAIYSTAKRHYDIFTSTVFSRHVLGKLEEIGYKFY